MKLQQGMNIVGDTGQALFLSSLGNLNNLLKAACFLEQHLEADIQSL
jgi:hypothetical protein